MALAGDMATGKEAGLAGRACLSQRGGELALHRHAQLTDVIRRFEQISGAAQIGRLLWFGDVYMGRVGGLAWAWVCVCTCVCVCVSVCVCVCVCVHVSLSLSLSLYVSLSLSLPLSISLTLSLSLSTPHVHAPTNRPLEL